MFRVFALVSLLSVAAAVDDTSLVQSTINLHQDPVGRDAVPAQITDGNYTAEDCYCVHWDQVYSQNLVKYGDAHEDTAHSASEPYRHFTHDLCMKVNKASKFLANGVIQQNEMQHAAWCYVSTDCANWRYGKQVNDKVAWKNCDESWEKRAADVPIPDFIEQIKKDGQMKEARLIATMSYPYSKHMYNEVLPFITGKGYPKAHELIMAKHDSWEHQVQRTAKYPMIYCSAPGTDFVGPLDGKKDGEICGGDHSFRMVQGKQVWMFPVDGEPVCETGCPNSR